MVVVAGHDVFQQYWLEDNLAPVVLIPWYTADEAPETKARAQR